MESLRDFYVGKLRNLDENGTRTLGTRRVAISNFEVYRRVNACDVKTLSDGGAN